MTVTKRLQLFYYSLRTSKLLSGSSFLLLLFLLSRAKTVIDSSVAYDLCSPNIQRKRSGATEFSGKQV